MDSYSSAKMSRIRHLRPAQLWCKHPICRKDEQVNKTVFPKIYAPCIFKQVIKCKLCMANNASCFQVCFWVHLRINRRLMFQQRVGLACWTGGHVLLLTPTRKKFSKNWSSEPPWGKGRFFLVFIIQIQWCPLCSNATYPLSHTRKHR